MKIHSSCATLSGAAVVAVVLTVAGCSPTATKPATNRSGSPNDSAGNSQSYNAAGSITSAVRTALPDVIRRGKVEFRVGEGAEIFSFRPNDDGTACKFYDAAGKELCKLTFAGGKLNAKTPDDQPLFELKPKDEKLMIKDATGEIELFKLKFKGDTIDCYKPNDVRFHRIKKQDYGWRLEDNDDTTLFRAKSHEGKMVLRDANDNTVLYSKDIPSPLGLVFFRIDELSLEQQAACCVMFLDR